MSTKPPTSQMETTTPTTRTPSEHPFTRNSFALENAQRTFDPLNTQPCPEMFSGKWTAESE